MNHSPDTGTFQVIHAYTRAEAIGDGVLVDVTDTAREAGYLLPVAMTAAAWAEAVAWDESNRAPQDVAGRLWDVLWMARPAAARTGFGQTRIAFDVLRVPNVAAATEPHGVTLYVHIGPGDDGHAVLTVLLPHED